MRAGTASRASASPLVFYVSPALVIVHQALLVALWHWLLEPATRCTGSRRRGFPERFPSWAILHAYGTRATKKFPCSRWTNNKSWVFSSALASTCWTSATDRTG